MATMLTDLGLQSTQYLLSATFTNPGNGIDGTYDSASTNVFQNLLDLGLVSAPAIQNSGDVYDGWDANTNALGVTSFTNNGIVPDGTYTVFDEGNMVASSTVTFSSLEENGIAGHQAGFTAADVASPSWDPSLYDGKVYLSDDPEFIALVSSPNYTGNAVANQQATFTGVQDFDNSYTGQAPMFQYVNPNHFTPGVPEVGVGLLIPLAAALYSARRSR